MRPTVGPETTNISDDVGCFSFFYDTSFSIALCLVLVGFL